MEFQSSEKRNCLIDPIARLRSSTRVGSLRRGFSGERLERDSGASAENGQASAADRDVASGGRAIVGGSPQSWGLRRAGEAIRAVGSAADAQCGLDAMADGQPSGAGHFLR